MTSIYVTRGKKQREQMLFKYNKKITSFFWVTWCSNGTNRW